MEPQIDVELLGPERGDFTVRVLRKVPE